MTERTRKEAAMNDERGESRRKFILMLAATGALVAIGGVAAKRSFDRKLVRRMVRVFDQSEAAEAIGGAWLKDNPGLADSKELTRALTADLGPGTRFAAAEELRPRIAARVREDYASGQVQQAGGWLLSITELRLCALAALAAQNRRLAAPAPATPKAAG